MIKPLTTDKGTVINGNLLTIKTLLDKANDTKQDQLVAEIAYNGLCAASDYGIAIDTAFSAHPLSSMMAANAYLSTVATMPQVSITFDIASGVCVLSADSVNAYRNVNAQTNHKTYVDNLAVPAGQPGVVASYNFGSLVPISSPTIFTSRSSSIDVSVAGYQINGGYTRSFTGTSIANGTLMKEGQVNIPAGRYVKDFLTDIKLKCLNKFWKFMHERGLDVTHVVSEPGVNVGKYYLNGTVPNPTNFSVDFPFIRGTRRVVIVTEGGASDEVLVLSCYIMGEGRDICISDFIYASGNPEGPALKAVDQACVVEINPYRDRALSSVFTLQTLKTFNLYMMSWNFAFVDSISGKVDKFEDMGHSLETYATYYIKLHFNVGTIRGSVSRDRYREYLSTGFDVHTPLAEGKVSSVLNTWKAIPDSVTYTMKADSVKDLTFKNTKLFKEYAKKRQQACKTNDFFEKSYNQEFTYKTVENKLNALSVISCVCMDSSLASSTTSKKTTFIMPTVQFTDAGVMLAYATSTGLSGKIGKTEEAIIALFSNELAAGFNITAGKELVESIIGASLSEYNAAATSSIDHNSMSMKLSDKNLGLAPQISDIVDIDAKVAYAASQVTDYAILRAAIPNLVTSLMGSKLYPALVGKFTS